MKVQKSKNEWCGYLGRLMKEHLELRKAMGRVGDADENVLRQLNRFIIKRKITAKTMTRKMIVDFLKTKSKLSPWGRRNAIIHIRQFCRFLRQRGIASYSPDHTLLPKLTYQIRYHPFTLKEVEAMMKEARARARSKVILGETIAEFIGLLWCTGMRHQEVIKLEHADIDFKEKTILIRMTKFRKTRLIPISDSVVLALKEYVSLKKRVGFGVTEKNAFLVGEDGKRISQRKTLYEFNRVLKNLKIGKIGREKPRVHDLRHSFATLRLKSFYQSPDQYPPQSYLPVLSTFLGHTRLVYSQYYLHPDFELMKKAGEKLEERFKESLRDSA
jgi:integrase/recombinase XerD